MVAIIKSSASLRNVLQYNENKAKQKVAELIHSMNFGKDTEKLGFTDKIRTLEKITSLNERTKLKAVHISLNFDPREKLAKETLSQIADTYMREIGFGDQPYLVYQHNDAGHPHIHIVSTNIQKNGRRIGMQNIGRNQSEKARKEIEKEFKLVQAEKSDMTMQYELKPVNAQKLQYGRTETKRAITNVLDKILPSYKYTSLPELNAVLRNYNIVADRGSENSRTFKSNGLVYRALDEKGEKVGAPIKASAIYSKPTIKFLNEKFAQNETARQKFKPRIRNAIDLSLFKNPEQSIGQLINNLEEQGIQVLLRQNGNGIIYGITYIDHDSKCVFNGSDLGKQYSANQMQQRCSQETTLQSKVLPTQNLDLNRDAVQKEPENPSLGFNAIKNVLEKLVEEEPEESLSSELREELRRRKRKKHYH